MMFSVVLEVRWMVGIGMADAKVGRKAEMGELTDRDQEATRGSDSPTVSVRLPLRIIAIRPVRTSSVIP